jgi:hypothetical protein
LVGRVKAELDELEAAVMNGGTARGKPLPPDRAQVQ